MDHCCIPIHLVAVSVGPTLWSPTYASSALTVWLSLWQWPDLKPMMCLQPDCAARKAETSKQELDRPAPPSKPRTSDILDRGLGPRHRATGLQQKNKVALIEPICIWAVFAPSVGQWKISRTCMSKLHENKLYKHQVRIKCPYSLGQRVQNTQSTTLVSLGHICLTVFRNN